MRNNKVALFHGDIAAIGSRAQRSFEGQVLIRPRREEDPRWNEYFRFASEWSDVVVVGAALQLDVLDYFMGRENVVAIITNFGGITSHGAITARETLSKSTASHQVVIAGASGVYSKLNTGDRVRIELNDDGTAQITRLTRRNMQL